MKITPEDVRHVAALARLRLTADEEARFVGQLDAILRYVEKLDELDTAEVPPTSHAVELETVFRPDAACPSSVAGEVLENAPDRSGSFFRVPKIIES